VADVKTTMSSSRPYLVRALNEWVLDNDCTPYIVVDAGIQGVRVPN
jgi:stringent starvation protein B